MLFYLIVYDIPDDPRRKKIAETLEGYGKRVQYSVFECVLSQPQYRELKKRLRKLFQTEEDNIRFYSISSHTLDTVEAWGGPPITEAPRSIIV